MTELSLLPCGYQRYIIDCPVELVGAALRLPVVRSIRRFDGVVKRRRYAKSLRRVKSCRVTCAAVLSGR